MDSSSDTPTRSGGGSDDGVELQKLTPTSEASDDTSYARADSVVDVKEIELFECRICSEDDVAGNLECPCKCAGTVKWAHHECVQKWINEKGNKLCEICNSEFQGDFSVPEPAQLRDLSLDALSALPFLGPFRQRYMVRTAGGFSDVPIISLGDEMGNADMSNVSSQRVGGAYCLTLGLLMLGTVLLHRSSLALEENGPHNGTSSSVQLPSPSVGAVHQYPHPRHETAWHASHRSSPQEANLDIGVLMFWFLIRIFLVILPLLVVMRVFMTVREARHREEVAREAASSTRVSQLDVVRLLQQMEAGAFRSPGGSSYSLQRNYGGGA
eukprot:CAMPEP_0177789700 /NCGR_PEP_ID=MMETSP0491_2-20121128/22916_1 /TAXON_ID=63592 /ORGANISM="Tetraselmis chuii, Strain PLY429" /LENGTH=325 /DNA_ID=CAMNT_0019311635 /DNA_START=65 /DNA_END=1042 /DNA_ORIENTATION=-